MTKNSNKNKNKKSYYLKDKSLKKFILSHSKKIIIDFSKIKIPSFIEFISEENKNQEIKNLNNKNIFQTNKNIINGTEKNLILNCKKLPKFKLSLFEENVFGNINNNTISESKINSFLFD